MQNNPYSPQDPSYLSLILSIPGRILNAPHALRPRIGADGAAALMLIIIAVIVPTACLLFCLLLVPVTMVMHIAVGDLSTKTLMTNSASVDSSVCIKVYGNSDDLVVFITSFDSLSRL